MSYSAVTDFLALLRNTSGGVRTESMPGLDFVIAAMARAGMFLLSTGATAPTTNQTTTLWFLPSNPSWVAEGTVFLWNAATNAYAPATPALWDALFNAVSSANYSFQSATGANTVILSGTSLLAIQRAAPTVTGLTLPSIAAQGTKKLQIVDWSTALAGNDITLTPNGTDTIMQKNSWQMFSTADQAAGIMLQPSPDLGGWVIAP